MALSSGWSRLAVLGASGEAAAVFRHNKTGDLELGVYDTHSGKRINTFDLDNCEADALSASANGTVLIAKASMYFCGIARDTTTGNVLWSEHPHWSDFVKGIAVSPDGKRYERHYALDPSYSDRDFSSANLIQFIDDRHILGSGYSFGAKIFDLQSRTWVYKIPQYDYREILSSGLFAVNGGLAVNWPNSASDHTLNLFNTRGGSLALIAKIPFTGRVDFVATSPDGNSFVTIGRDSYDATESELRLWSLKNPDSVVSTGIHNVVGAQYAADGESVISLSKNENSLHVLKTADGVLTREVSLED